MSKSRWNKHNADSAYLIHCTFCRVSEESFTLNYKFLSCWFYLIKIYLHKKSRKTPGKPGKISIWSPIHLSFRFKIWHVMELHVYLTFCSFVDGGIFRRINRILPLFGRHFCFSHFPCWTFPVVLQDSNNLFRNKHCPGMFYRRGIASINEYHTIPIMTYSNWALMGMGPELWTILRQSFHTGILLATVL